MKSERHEEIAKAVSILRGKLLEYRPGKRNGGFNDGPAQMQHARINALTHQKCAGCAHLSIKISEDKVGVGCTSGESPAGMWAEHSMTGVFGTQPMCDSFTAAEEAKK